MRTIKSIPLRMIGGWLLSVIFTLSAQAVEDGLGTNHVAVLSADGILLGGELITKWPETAIKDSVGGTLTFHGLTNAVAWAAAVRGDGELETARMITDSGEADVVVVRAQWNDDWDTYEEVLSLTVDSSGVQSTDWSSSWVSNTYRIGVIVTNYTTGSNLWWSIDYTR